jgi:hypothetical protein
VLGVACFGMAASAQTNAGAAAASPAVLEYSSDASTVLVHLRERLVALEDEDPGPSLSVYGDGRVAVHYPRYMKRAGEYTLQLGPQDLGALMRSLASRGLLEFDAVAVARRKAEAARSRAQLFEVFDATTTEIELRVERYQPVPGAPELRNVHKRLSWNGLRADAKRYPEVAELADLAAARQELGALMESPDLVRGP